MKKQNGDVPMVLDSGTMGGADYTIYDVWGTIHIQNKGKKAIFKKDLEAFNEILETHDWENMSDGDDFFIQGSGTNPGLTISISKGDLVFTVQQKYKFPALNSILETLNINKNRIGKKS